MPQIGNADVTRLLKQYGLANPTDAEVAMFTGIDVIGGAAESSIAAYANAKEAETERQASDPLKAYQALTEKYASDSILGANNLYEQLQSVLTEAPKLFGNLTADQIQTYMSPLTTAYQSGLASVQGIIASRGLAASSTENAALAQTNKEFQQQVFSTGLDVGMSSQKARASAMTEQIKNLFSVGTSSLGEAGAAARQRSSQDLGQSNLIASLPYFLRSTGIGEANAKIAADTAKSDNGGFFNKMREVTGAINEGVGAFQSIAMIPQQFRTVPGGSSTPYTPSNPSTSGFAPQTPANPFASTASMGPGGVNAMPPSLDLFQMPVAAAAVA